MKSVFLMAHLCETVRDANHLPTPPMGNKLVSLTTGCLWLLVSSPSYTQLPTKQSSGLATLLPQDVQRPAARSLKVKPL